MKILIVTEGGKDFGLGHVIRCLSLAQVFDEKNIETKFIVNADQTVNNYLAGRNFEIMDWLKHSEKIFARSINDFNIVILDSYDADYNFCRRISELAKLPVYIDDYKRIEYTSGIIANWAISENDLSYPKKRGISHLFGNKYVALRKEFWDVPVKQINKDIKTVMVTFGGYDTWGMTAKIMEFLNKNYPELIIKVIIGKTFENIEYLKKNRNKNTELIFYPEANLIKQTMFESDIAITSSGQVLYELARMGVPTITITVAKNQLSNVDSLKKSGFLEYAGWFEDKSIFKNIKNCVEFLTPMESRINKSKMGQSLIDGKGGIRLVEKLMEYSIC